MPQESSSRYLHVCRYKRSKTKPWLVKMHKWGGFGERTAYLGYYADEEEAGRVADVAELMVNGPEAKLNFTPPRKPETVSVVEIYSRLRAAEMVGGPEIIQSVSEKLRCN